MGPILDDVTTPLMQAERRPERKSRGERTSRGERNSRGATMVEFGIIAIALFSLIFGIIEGAFAVRARNAVNNAIDDAARRGAVAGSSTDADWLILNQIVGRGAADAATIEYVVVYRADNGSADVPAGCIDGLPQNGDCNVYFPATLENIDSNRAQFDCVQLGNDWCANNRGTAGQLGFLGVYVKAKYEPIIDQIFFDFSFDVNANSLQAIETSGEL